MSARILVIEDDDFSRDLLKYLLEAGGYQVLLAEDGRLGVELALAAKPDLIFCDLQMPDMNGFGVAATLIGSADWHRVPLIAVSAFSMSADRHKALAAGFDHHISKPVDSRTFVVQLEAWLPPSLLAARPATDNLPKSD